MSQIDIGNEAPLSSGRRLACRHGQCAAGPIGLVDRFGDLLGRHFLDVLAHFPKDCLVSVSLPALRAGHSVIGIGFSGAFERYMAACAENFDCLHGDPTKDDEAR